MKATHAIHYDRRQQIDGETAITEKHHSVVVMAASAAGVSSWPWGKDEVGRRCVVS